MNNLKLVVGMYASQLEERVPTQKVYKTNIKTIKVGDFCIAESAKGMIVVKIVRVCNSDADLQEGSFSTGIVQSNWIIKRVNVDDYQDMKLKRKRLTELDIILDEMFNIEDRMLRYELYAKVNEKFKVLLDEYNNLLV